MHLMCPNYNTPFDVPFGIPKSQIARIICLPLTLLFIFFISACSFPSMGRNEVEETPIQLEAYQPTSNIGTAVENDVPAANTNNATSGDSSVTPVAAAGNVSTSESSSTDG